MASVSNAHQPKEELINSGDEIADRLSSLPDQILVHILSFLPTKYSVGTCVLSKRWEILWASVPILDFNQDLLFHPVSSGRGNGPFRLNAKRFVKFVERVLHSYNLSSIRRFCLKADLTAPSYLTEWLSFTIRRRVEEIEIDGGGGNHDCLPTSLFTSRSLAVLKLMNFGELKSTIPNSVHFPSLKIFHISLFSPSKELMQKLFCGCPLLEELVIDMILDDENNDTTLNISAPALKRLCIRLGGLFIPDPGQHEVVISAPKLEYLTLTDWQCPTCLMKDSSSLIKAFVNVGFVDVMIGIPESETINRLRGLLRGISNVNVLSLSCSTLLLLNLGGADNMPIFDNLIGLRLDIFYCRSLKLLPYLLESSPNLQDLSFYRDDHFNQIVEETTGLILPDLVPNCLCSKLKSVEFVNCFGRADELKVIEYLLRKAKVLKKLNFHFKDIGPEEKKKFLSQTLALPRASTMLNVAELLNISDCLSFKWLSSDILNYNLSRDDSHTDSGFLFIKP